nr:2'-5' RNA ligase family protein [Saccharopolyspora sp. HNM0983]
MFTALWPSAEAVDDLVAALAALDEHRVAAATAGLRTFRFVPSARWHLTLCFHGDDADEHDLAERLEAGAARAAAYPPALRVAGAGVFRGVLWAGVRPAGAEDGRALRELVRAAGGDPEAHRAHLTVARWAAGRADRAALTGLLDGYAGPWWTADELALVRSEQRAGGREYRTVHRVPVTRGRSG